jgi:CRP/FNR family cyclic AMP-dependent transcriptional regulator
MDDLNFTLTPAVSNGPEKSGTPGKSSYDAAAARKFFESAGEEQEVAAGEVIFAEEEKGNRLFFQRDKMYFLAEGEIELTVNENQVGSVKKGEIFGELASITHAARSATATAKTPCRLVALDDKQFRAALREEPEFALTLMGLMVGRLRKMIAALNASGALSADKEWQESVAFNQKLLAELEEELGDSARKSYGLGTVIMQEGQAGILMFVVLEGSVAVTIQGRDVEKIGPGGMFGEMALIERSARLASAVAETDCELLAINRKAFLNLVENNPEFGVVLLSAVGERARFMTSRAS